MSDTSQQTETPVPEIIQRYQQAHDRHDTDTALSTFTADALVIDEDRQHRGTAEIRQWLATAASEYTYTRTYLSAQALDNDSWVVVNRLEGNFPGNVVDLRYQFALTGQLISELVIAP